MTTKKIRYVGGKSGPSPYFGTVTGALYRFGTLRPEQEVYADDVDGFLSLYEGQTQAFEVVGAKKQEEKPVEKPAHEETSTTNHSLQPSPPADLPVEPFDFTTLAGIGPARRQALHDAGIITKVQFMTASNLADILGANDKTIKSWRDILK